LQMVATLNLVLAEGDDGYLYGGPSGEQLQEISAVNRPRKYRLNPRAYPQPLSQACGDEDAESHAAAVATYHASRPHPRRISHHKEVVVDPTFFEPSEERIEELRRFALDQQ
ncbi:hypothetical protein KR054_010231, partial [Drosophila jambulina]